MDLDRIDDLARYPELRWLHRNEFLPASAMAVGCLAIAGWPGLVISFVWSTVAVYHSTFCINSLAHMSGRQRYVTGDGSRNNVWLALLTLGEGWHNNHHACQRSARQGFLWWEVDPTFYVLWTLSKLGVIWDLKSPPAELVRNKHRLSARVVDRAAAQLLERYDALTPRLIGPPTRPLLEVLAAAMFARTGCLSRIVDRAGQLLAARTDVIAEGAIA